MLESLLPILIIVAISVIGNLLEKKKKEAAQRQREQNPAPVDQRRTVEQNDDDEDWEEEVEPERPVPAAPRQPAPTPPPMPSHQAPPTIAPNPLQDLLRRMQEAQEAARRIAQAPAPVPTPAPVVRPHSDPTQRVVVEREKIPAPTAPVSVGLDTSPQALRQAMLWKTVLEAPRAKEPWIAKGF